jgi:hypothetical protein
MICWGWGSQEQTRLREGAVQLYKPPNASFIVSR